MVFKPQTFHAEEPEIQRENPPVETLESLVAEALARTASTDASRVEVTATGSEITLTGYGDPEAVGEIAALVPGVGHVVNRVRTR